MDAEQRAWRALNWTTVILYSAHVAERWCSSAEERRGGAELDILVGYRVEEEEEEKPVGNLRNVSLVRLQVHGHFRRPL